MAALSIFLGIVACLFGIGWYIYVKFHSQRTFDLWFYVALVFSCCPFIFMTYFLQKGMYGQALGLSVAVIAVTWIQVVLYKKKFPERF